MNEDLKKWFKDEWVRIDTQGNIAGECGTMKSKTTPTRCLPKSKAQSLTKGERKATVAKKLAGGKKGKQFVANTKKAKVVRESKRFYTVSENIAKLKDTLSPEIFDENGKMKSEVRDNLLMLSKEFMKFLEMPMMLEDIILTGSLANYNWSDQSDVDLHIVVDFNNFGIDKDVLKKYFDAKKTLWNTAYPIKVKQYDVELYVQDSSEVHTSTGVYSIKDDEWVVEPKRVDVQIDLVKVREKSNLLAKEIDDLITSALSYEVKLDKIDKLKNKIKNYRKSGLESGGEYSYENLAFKHLRNSGYLQKLADFKNYLITKTYTLLEKDDRCTRIAKQKYEEWPSAYASGAVVRCRQGKIWKDLKEDANSSLSQTKIVDKNGNPLIVYRSQEDNRPLNVNRQSKHKGIYFSANKESTKIYGDITKKYFLNIKNPLVLKDKEWYLSVIPDYLYDWLIKQGYDGAVWLRKGEMYEVVAFYPQQVISADIEELKEDATQDDNYRLEEINKFANFCSKKLNVEPPNIKLHTTSEYTDNNKSFGGYDIADNSIMVSIHNRNLADILRTVAHELVHHKQNSKGILNIDSGDDGSPHENQANKIAGIMLRLYSKDNPHIYE